MENIVKHFEITHWVDFIRAVGTDEHAGMQQHLSAGCEPCGRTVDLLRRFAAAAVAAEVAPAVPAAVLRRAQAIARLHQPEKVGLVQLIARLVYDSFREPLPAGIRTDRTGTRQILYEAGDICIDLRLEFERAGRLVSLVGQVSSCDQSDRCVAALPLTLMSGAEVLAQTTTNQYGEFQFEYEPRQPLSIHLAWQGSWIQIPLADDYEMAA
jgi:hypothetical protein